MTKTPEEMLGWLMKDVITGFVGNVTGVAYYISGCNQALIQPKVKEDGSIKEGQWFDFQRLENTGGERIVLDNGDTPGCDMEAPKR